MKGYQKSTLLFNTYTVTELVLIFGKLNDDIHLLKKYASLDLLPINGLVMQYNKRLKEFVKLSDAEAVKQCNNEIHQIIISLQTHDIISQKLEHIELIHTAITNELLSLKVSTDLSQTDYISVILEIIIMNREQLIIIKEEFTGAVDLVCDKLNNLESMIFKLTAIPSDLERLFSNTLKFEKLTDNISMRMLDMANKINHYNIKGASKEEKLKRTASIFTMESEREVLHRILHGDNVAHLNSTVTKNAELDQTEFF